MAKLGQYYAAALIDISRQMEDDIVQPRENLKDVIKGYWEFSVSDDDISDAVRLLHRCDIAYSADDEYAGSYTVVSWQRYQSFLEKVSQERLEYNNIVKAAPDENLGISRAEDTYHPHLEAYNTFDVLRKYSAFGGEWLSRAMEEIQRRSIAGELSVPASDRVVQIDDNDPQIIEIKEAAAGLEDRLVKGNEIGSLTHEQAQVAAQEISQIRESLSKGFVRPSEILKRVKQTLGWIGEKAAGTVIGQAATTLFKMIMNYFGISM